MVAKSQNVKRVIGTRDLEYGASATTFPIVKTNLDLKTGSKLQIDYNLGMKHSDQMISGAGCNQIIVFHEPEVSVPNRHGNIEPVVFHLNQYSIINEIVNISKKNMQFTFLVAKTGLVTSVAFRSQIFSPLFLPPVAMIFDLMGLFRMRQILAPTDRFNWKRVLMM